MPGELEKSSGVSNPLVLLQSAIDRGLNPDQLERLLDLQERWERNRAAESFSRAVSNFQASVPAVFKRRKADGSKVKFAFASYDDVMREAGPVLAQCGIAISFTTEPAGEHAIKATCRVRHGIHHEDTTLTLPIPQGTVNDTQLHAQCLTYLKRQCLCLALNIVVTDEDDDASGAMDAVTPEQARQIYGLIEEKAVDLKRFLQWAGADGVEAIPRKDFPKVTDMLRRKKAPANGVAK